MITRLVIKNETAATIYYHEKYTIMLLKNDSKEVLGTEVLISFAFGQIFLSMQSSALLSNMAMLGKLSGEVFVNWKLILIVNKTQ